MKTPNRWRNRRGAAGGASELTQMLGDCFGVPLWANYEGGTQIEFGFVGSETGNSVPRGTTQAGSRTKEQPAYEPEQSPNVELTGRPAAQPLDCPR